MNFIVLSSSRGTTFQATIDAMKKGELKATCLGLLTDSPERGCIEKAKKAGIPVSIVERRKGDSREDFDRRVDQALRDMGADDRTVLAAMGWMFIFSEWFIAAWNNRIINVHPALLPKHGGEGMYGHHVHDAVLAAGEKESGVTIHLMDDGVDTGPILVQKKCSVLPHDTAETLQKRVQELEKEWYPKVLQMIEIGTVRLPIRA
ncbi:MAG: phosphoribosylglycinamide formyltransferase [Candidatus Peribacteraceae bacterium]|nr:phosphoribosylglycinamide formyltransferase [Candidatus Peribacteraceae bacterium]MDD5074676.1 phosphoribosylglycinamide formyltransferase [Candidatus Peribacteraceae bacterium]